MRRRSEARGRGIAMPDQHLTHRSYIRNNAIDAISFLKEHRADIWLRAQIRLHYEEMKNAD